MWHKHLWVYSPVTGGEYSETWELKTRLEPGNCSNLVFFLTWSYFLGYLTLRIFVSYRKWSLL